MISLQTICHLSDCMCSTGRLDLSKWQNKIIGPFQLLVISKWSFHNANILCQFFTTELWTLRFSVRTLNHISEEFTTVLSNPYQKRLLRIWKSQWIKQCVKTGYWQCQQIQAKIICTFDIWTTRWIYPARSQWNKWNMWKLMLHGFVCSYL